MRRLNSHQVGVDQGAVLLFSDYQHDGVMWTGEGAREFRKIVEFDEPFASPPVVQLSPSMWDFDHQTNQRADLSCDMVNPEGFVIVFRTWGDTRIARLRVAWTAIGELRDEDDWTLY